MKIDIYAKNYEVGEKLKNVTEQKLSKLDKYFKDDETVAKVTFKKQATSLTTEIMLDFNGKFVRATATSDNFYDNIDIILPKLEGQIRKHRTRFDKHNKNAAFGEASIYDIKNKEEHANSQVVKKKSFVLSPMTVKEAEEEMELLGHSFYVFLEAKSNTVQVLYKRNDGDLGLIEPQI
ncbi:MAG: ribosome-associated translation inhibitor RaiA [Clostridia bacterium]|nr:ribosome-associated translation inhibitor RaiA [Clostridia bacterium]